MPSPVVIPRGSVIVEGDGAPRSARRMINRLRISVEGRGGSVEYDAAVKGRDHARAALSHRAIPDLEASTVFLFPIAIEVDQHVDPAFKVHDRVVIEIRVNTQMAAVRNLVESRAKEVRIGNQPFYAREILQK